MTVTTPASFSPAPIRRSSSPTLVRLVDEPVFAVNRTPAGRWSILAPACRDLSGRIGVHRIATLEEPAAGGAKVIKLRERA